ncbi:TetR/AcrR family transcriptional regulator [Deltaproteobacteria bacterium OttesenSCG-928-K17]|nr:TetR/AcrR family transcriptional regulator [Deltaproteobacteria bacterium OttesenSCG-928-K17]
MQTTKEKLIAAGSELFLIHSYQGTGINEVLRTCGVPKGSFYNYFASKEEFALAVIENQMEQSAEFVLQNLCNQALSPLKRIAAYLDSISQGMVSCHFAMGCLFGTLAQEMSSLSPKLRHALTRAFQVQVDHLTDCLRLGQSQGEIRKDLDAAEMAGFIMSALQGAQIMAKTFVNSAPLCEVRHLVVDVLLPVAADKRKRK